MSVFDFLNKYNGALMVIITLIYVIATIAIWRANNKSASATEKQLIESKRQFVENQRLQVLPSLQMEVEDPAYASYEAELDFTLFADEPIEKCRKTCWCLSLENAGLGTAKNLTFTWIGAEGNEESDKFPKSVLYQQDTVKYMISVGIANDNAKVGSMYNTQLNICFKDLLDNQYKQTISLFYKINENNYAVLQDYTVEKIEQIE